MSSTDNVSILEGNTFVVSDRRGDVAASPTDTQGLFHADTRFLSRWILTINGQRMNALSTDDLDYFAAQFFLVPGTGAVYIDSPMSVVRRRMVGEGFYEEIKIANHIDKAMDLDIHIEADVDFADIFEVKDMLSKKGECYRRAEEGKLILGYRRDRFIRETMVRSTPSAEITEKGLRFHAHLEPHQEWNARLEVVVARDGLSGVREHTKYGYGNENAQPNIGINIPELLHRAPQLASSWQPLERIYRRSLIDLAALRFYAKITPGQALPAAGLPWFMAVFGRDSLLTSLQALPFQPELAETTLRVLGARQGTRRDDFRDEEPGKILHESRMGEMTAFEERPHSPYFGTADATPLFLILLDEYERWSGKEDIVRQFEREARAALRWIDEFGDRDGDGYVEYDTRNKESGLANQCWKDSWDSIRFSDGSIAPLPRATCEIQGYIYDAKCRCARLARQFWNDPALAERLEKEAADLKKRFNRDFWIDDRQFFALALDGQKRKVDALSSNIGHLLWSGIADLDKAQHCVRHLMSDALFSGWGVRTMASTEGGYNPIGYHVGTVWPHDNSFIALGLRRYGYRQEAARVAAGILDAATYFNYRLPEAFAGYPRKDTKFPVEYPTACSPQAWATGAPLLFFRTLLGLEPVGNNLLVDPAIPKKIERLELTGIPGRWGTTDAFGRGLIDIKESTLKDEERVV
jgi:glycogen debranching enzyme